MEPSQFKRDCIMKGLNELNKQDDFEASLKIIKQGRKVAGYEMTIISDRGNDKKVLEGEVVQVKEAPASDLDQFFKTFKKVTGVSLTEGQKNKTNELVEVFEPSERLQILDFAQKLFVEYGGQTYAYLFTIVTRWKDNNLKTLADVEAFYKKGKSGADESSESNVPKWSNPDYENEISEEYIEKLIETQKILGIYGTPEAEAEIADKRAKRAELEAKKWELLGRLDKKENL